MLQKYKGNLGTFTYDTEQFRIAMKMIYKPEYHDGRIPMGVDYLEYIGNETDGKKITIPDGVNNCEDLFSYRHLVTLPRIPKSVKIATRMFYYCIDLEEVDYLPPYIEQADSMFYECSSLKKVITPLPNKLQNAERMFMLCENLTEIQGSIPLHLNNANSMFQQCSNLIYAPKIDRYSHAFSADDMFSGCQKLKNAYNFEWLFLNSRLFSIRGIYKGCNRVRFQKWYKTKPLIKVRLQDSLFYDMNCPAQCFIEKTIMPLQIDNVGLEIQFKKIMENQF